MKIRRKEIIREIICEEAKNRGFEVIWGTKTGSTWNIALFSRDGYGQRFDIVEDSYHKETIVLYFSTKVISYKYNSDDEMSYREAVRKMEEFLEKEGYSILDELRKQHTIQREDRDYVYDNLDELSKQFCDDNGINDVEINQALEYIAEAFLGMRGKKWEDIKQDFYKVTAFYISTLLKMPSLELYREQIAEGMDKEIQKEKGKSLDIRRIDNKYINAAPLNGALGNYYSDRGVKKIIDGYIFELNRLLTIEELEKSNIKVEQWKIDEATMNW